MRRLGGALLAAATLLCGAPVAWAQGDGPNLLIISEDAGPDTVPRDSPVFKRVLDVLTEQVHALGFDPYDAAAVAPDGLAHGRDQRGDAELIDLARSLREPAIDVVLVVAFAASAERQTYTTTIRARIAGRLLRVADGRRIGTYEAARPESWRVPVSCTRACIQKSTGDNAAALARDLGAALRDKLAGLADDVAAEGRGPADGYTLVLRNFTDAQVRDIEDYLIIFAGYVSHRVTRAGPRRVEYAYETSIAPLRLNRNLNEMLEQLELSGRVALAGNRVEVEKLSQGDGG